jgi:hypothetical protein
MHRACSVPEDFVVTSAARGTAAWRAVVDPARNTFGLPARTYSFQQNAVLAWGKNLLARLR